MKKTLYLLFVACLLSITLNAQVTNTVTFVADLTDLISQGFDSATDTLEIRGLDWDNGADVTVAGDRFLTVDPGNSNLYQTTLTITAGGTLAVGDSLRWKFHGYPEGNFDPPWEPGVDGYDGRPLVLQADASTFNDGPHVPKMDMFVGGLINTITFKADLTDIFGSGVGFFDPAVDNIEIRGFWDDAGLGHIGGTVLEGSMGPLTRNLDPGVVYETTLKIQAPAGTMPGATTQYKFKTYPDERWADGGWEIGSNTVITYQADGAEFELLRKPNVFPKGEALGQAVDVLFQCYLPPNAANFYDNSVIPRDQVEFVILKGDNPAIGLWGGDWVAADTLTEGAIACYDNGTNGDKVAGDYIFSKVVTFADTLLSGGVIYKFGAQYPDAGVISQSAPLDNSYGTGQNFSFILRATDTTVVRYDEWPTLAPNMDPPTNTVTFVADLTDLISQGFDSATDTLEIRGLDWDNGADVVVTGDRFLTVDPGNSNLYQTTLTIATSGTIAPGDSLRWKFHGYPEGNFDPPWEPGVDGYDGRPLVLQTDGSTFNDGPHVPKMNMFVGGLINDITFKADLTDLFGSGVGFFDPAVDNIEIRGFWDDAGLGHIGGTVLEGSMGPLTRNLDPGVIYETTIKLQAPAGTLPGATTQYKFKTYPDERWADGGWEIGSNTVLTYQADGAEFDELRKPNIFPKGEALGKDVDVLFQCFMPEDALNRYDSSLIPRDQIEFIILKGDNPAIGLWGGDWVASDTLTEGAVALFDNGTNGDITAGDYIFSKIVTFADTLLSGGVIYKFGAQYPDAGTVAQSAPLDNSRGVGQNFSFILRAVDTLVVQYEVWPLTGTTVSVEELGGQIPTSYSLEQNYPNPFNPSTTIRYSLPAASDVSLKIYNILGMEVAKLVNQKQAAGQYEATFDASNLSSGIYFYKLETAGVTISKKMMLLK